MRIPLWILPRPVVPFGVPLWEKEEFAAADRVQTRGDIGVGPTVARVEDHVRELVGTADAIATRSGREAIQLALVGMGLGPGDEVVLPTFVCGAVSAAVRNAGCRPIYADVNDTLTLDPEDLPRRLTERTRAIIVAHVGGKLADMVSIGEFARRRGLYVIEDAAPAFGVRYASGEWSGTLGDVGVYSFGSGKSLMASTGGMLVCPSVALAHSLRSVPLATEAPAVVLKRVRSALTAHKRRKWVWFPNLARRAAARAWGRLRPQRPEDKREKTLYRLSSMDAALLEAQLLKRDEILGRRRANAGHLARCLGVEHGVEPRRLEPDHGYTKFTVRVLAREDQPQPISRLPDAKSLQMALLCRGIATEWSHMPLHLRPEPQDRHHGSLHHSEWLWPGLLCLPVGPVLGDTDMDYIVQSMAEIARKRRRPSSPTTPPTAAPGARYGGQATG